jgi:hypothetical protein
LPIAAVSTPIVVVEITPLDDRTQLLFPTRRQCLRTWLGCASDGLAVLTVGQFLHRVQTSKLDSEEDCFVVIDSSTHPTLDNHVI